MHPARILIVDDQPAIRSLLERVLTLVGYTVSTAAAGMDAIRLFESLHPYALLLYINLPGMSGFEVWQMIRSGSTGPIILLTGNSKAEVAAQKDIHGADLVVEKPFNLVCLRKQLQVLLQNGSF